MKYQETRLLTAQFEAAKAPFVMVVRLDWLRVQQSYPEKKEEFGRYATEGVFGWH